MARPQINNNPFALIQKKPSPWKGLKGAQSDGFLTFENPMYGARAGFINLVNTYLKKGIDTIEKIFPIYAPAGHGANVPEDYIKRVVAITKIPRNQKLTYDNLYALGKAIVAHEEGNFWMKDSDYDEGFKQAMVATRLNVNMPAVAGGSILALAILLLIIIAL